MPRFVFCGNPTPPGNSDVVESSGGRNYLSGRYQLFRYTRPKNGETPSSGFASIADEAEARSKHTRTQRGECGGTCA